MVVDEVEFWSGSQNLSILQFDIKFLLIDVYSFQQRPFPTLRLQELFGNLLKTVCAGFFESADVDISGKQPTRLV
jgi:hypothetical protein